MGKSHYSVSTFIRHCFDECTIESPLHELTHRCVAHIWNFDLDPIWYHFFFFFYQNQFVLLFYFFFILLFFIIIIIIFLSFFFFWGEGGGGCGGEEEVLLLKGLRELDALDSLSAKRDFKRVVR